MFSFEYCKNFKNNLFYRPHPVAAFPIWTINNLQNSSLELLKLWQCIYFCTGLNIYFLSQEIFFGRTNVTSNKVNFRPHTRQTDFWKKNQDIWNLCNNLELLYLVNHQTQVSTCPSASNRTSIRALSCLLSFVFHICFEAEPTT